MLSTWRTNNPTLTAGHPVRLSKRQGKMGCGKDFHLYASVRQLSITDRQT